MSAPLPTVTDAAKVETKNGIETATATAAAILERERPEPPKRDFTLPLNGEFNIVFPFPLKLLTQPRGEPANLTQNQTKGLNPDSSFT